MTLAQEYATTFKAMDTHAAQDMAVGKYLIEYKTIDRRFAASGALSCGVIWNLAARILELRKAGWDIATDKKTDPSNCHYHLISTPAPKQLAML